MFSSKRGRRGEKVINFPSVQREHNLTAEKMSDFWGENKKSQRAIPWHGTSMLQEMTENSYKLKGAKHTSKWLRRKKISGSKKLKDMATDLVCHCYGGHKTHNICVHVSIHRLVVSCLFELTVFFKSHTYIYIYTHHTYGMNEQIATISSYWHVSL